MTVTLDLSLELEKRSRTSPSRAIPTHDSAVPMSAPHRQHVRSNQSAIREVRL